MSNIKYTIEKLNNLEKQLEELSFKYSQLEQEARAKHELNIKELKEKYDKLLEKKQEEIAKNLELKYNSIAQNTILYYESINFKDIDINQNAELFLSLFRRELDEIRKNI